MYLSEGFWTNAQSVAWTMLLEFPWFAKADTRVNDGLSTYLRDQWRERVEAGSKIDCLSLARELEAELRERQSANAERLGLTGWEGK